MARIIRKIAVAAACMAVVGSVAAVAGYFSGGRTLAVWEDGYGVRFVEPEEAVEYAETVTTLPDFDSISIDVGKNSVEIASGKSLSMELVSYSYEGYDTYLHYEVRDGTLYVTRGQNESTQLYILNFGGNVHWLDVGTLTLTLPEGITYDSIEVKNEHTVSVAGVNARRLKVDSRYNSVSLANVTAEECAVDTQSANLSINGMKAHRLGLRTEYSDSEVKNIEAQAVELDLSGGRTTFSGFAADTLTGNTVYAELHFLGEWDAVRLGEVKLDGRSTSFTLDNMSAESLQLKTTYGWVSFTESDIDSLTLNLDSVQTEINGLDTKSAKVTAKYNQLIAENWVTYALEMNLDSVHTELDGEFLGESRFTTKYGTLLFTTLPSLADYRLELYAGSYQDIFVDDMFFTEKGLYGAENSAHSVFLKSDGTDVKLSFGGVKAGDRTYYDYGGSTTAVWEEDRYAPSIDHDHAVTTTRVDERDRPHIVENKEDHAYYYTLIEEEYTYR